ncbi:DUF2993 domain-containing protein [Cyanobium sp. CH-040]|uniref:LmeA family phospholipid-binding protein n=1 Tax=Cyanobium sp. CH-040 TaxID=2823708 RepID=UPI0020CD2325|nr:DUF2993 domain-containing protein [Cyanobium sp. CH-040]MCP9928494.1 DUF2993 domain-containing protein [Cyanobium sp. CH-040]
MTQSPPPPPPPAGPDGTGPDQGGPLLHLLSAALQLWLRQQCQRVETLEIQLRGSAGALLRGRLAGVQVKARGVTYQNLDLELVELVSGPLQVQMGHLWRGQGVQLQQSFRVSGLVSLTAAGLSRSFAQPRWRAIADQLAEELVGITPLVGLQVRGERLVLVAQGVAEPRPVELETTLRSCEGGVEVASLDGSLRSLLPFEPPLRLQRVAVEAGMVVLEGEATVIP